MHPESKRHRLIAAYTRSGSRKQEFNHIPLFSRGEEKKNLTAGSSMMLNNASMSFRLVATLAFCPASDGHPRRDGMRCSMTQRPFRYVSIRNSYIYIYVYICVLPVIDRSHMLWLFLFRFLHYMKRCCKHHRHCVWEFRLCVRCSCSSLPILICRCCIQGCLPGWQACCSMVAVKADTGRRWVWNGFDTSGRYCESRRVHV